MQYYLPGPGGNFSLSISCAYAYGLNKLPDSQPGVISSTNARQLRVRSPQFVNVEKIDTFVE